MPDMQSELGKISQLAGPDVSCDARGVAVQKAKRKSPHYKRRAPIAVKQLVGDHGVTKAAEMLGISVSGLSTMLSRDTVSETVERLAGMILHNEGKQVVAKKARLLICRLPQENVEAVTRVVVAFGGKVADFRD